VRELKKQANRDKPVGVLVRCGSFFLDRPIAFGTACRNRISDASEQMPWQSAAAG
jgi:hypothetical protein